MLSKISEQSGATPFQFLWKRKSLPVIHSATKQPQSSANFLLWIILIEIHKRSPSTMRIKLAETNKDFVQRNDPLTNFRHHNLHTNEWNYCNQIAERLSASNLLSGLENPPTTSSTADRSERSKAGSNLNSRFVELFHRFWTLRAARPLPPIHWWFFLSMFTRQNKVDCGTPRSSLVDVNLSNVQMRGALLAFIFK